MLMMMTTTLSSIYC